MAGCERCGGCRRRREPVFPLHPARITSASCTKSSLNTPNGKRPGDPPHRGAFIYGTRLRPGRRDSRLFPDDKNDKRTGLHLAAAFAGSRWIEIGSGEEDVVGLEVKTHGAGRPFRGDVLDDREFVW